MTNLEGNHFLHDAWVVQLDSLIKHAENIRRDNVMKYKGKELKAFDVGLHLIVLLMNAMIEDIQTGIDKDE
tara:strand:- start:5934 stop:6146 length:213 start_codon:yes stop_codon:yes gene_type:complete